MYFILKKSPSPCIDFKLELIPSDVKCRVDKDADGRITEEEVREVLPSFECLTEHFFLALPFLS